MLGRAREKNEGCEEVDHWHRTLCVCSSCSVPYDRSEARNAALRYNPICCVKPKDQQPGGIAPAVDQQCCQQMAWHRSHLVNLFEVSEHLARVSTFRPEEFSFQDAGGDCSETTLFVANCFDAHGVLVERHLQANFFNHWL
ncbi:unnamed protein product [Soboliphyme baturini]|uniref:Uncharacterized protein n=1 Tax=Soboliphyme baturini TaxID=241478 RepID=A0A183INZ6_9BILA|nr:unnamed protein product [Soboliphyme baturini]